MRKLKKRKKRKKKFQLIDPREFIGREIVVDGVQQPVTIEHVLGNIAHETHFEINGEHLVTMLNFYLQMMENRIPTPQEEVEWLSRYKKDDFKIENFGVLNETTH